MRNHIITQIFSIEWLGWNRIKLIRGLIIVGVILLSALIALQSSRLPLPFILTLIFGIGAIVVLLSWPQFGLLLIPIVGMFIPFTGPGGFNVSILLIALLLGIWILRMVVGDHKIQIVSSRPILPLIIFVMTSCGSDSEYIS